MSTSTSAYDPVAPGRRRSSRKILPQRVAGSAAVAGLVVGCAWTVYANIFAASVYPSVNSAAFDAPVIKRPVEVAARPAPPPFNEVFAQLTPPPSTAPKAETAGPSLMFDERFAAASPQGQPSRVVADATPQTDAVKSTDAKIAEASRPAAVPKHADASKTIPPRSVDATKKEAAANLQVALNTPTGQVETRPAEAKPAAKSSGLSVRDMAARAKAAVMSIASNDRQTMVEKLWGKREQTNSLLSFASADASVTGSIPSTLDQNPMLGGSPPYDRQTAVYDISARTVYLPDGTRLEAHSGLGSRLDDPRSSHLKMVGVTPPHIYELKPREALFHGVPALRLTPIGGESKIFNRSGLLAHTFMLGPNGDSNGCVSFKDYYAFLDAYRNKGIRRLAVLAKIQ
ncbi:DUF2778 domain-containing protein [Bradyrhizobium lablabi]|uniref:DUF2778 domain-containing protein n=1 Tax=Bradyrhizobium lablabi TaxID=722472 RepID=UPI001BAACF4C|nr:DUF2778 domain-containing protein [Bradyrhizobium lablabi]MBR0695166.1 DUF2778 domain-containing protein [Bradyrhizobium lablabi]